MRRMVLAAGLAAAVAAQGGVCIKEGDRIGFLGDSITAYGNWDAGYLPLTMKGLEIADVRAVKELTAKRPHPQGDIEVSLKFDGGKASGTVKTPVPGLFVFGDQTIPLVAGENAIVPKQKGT